ncbi:hypothetical protein ACU5B6_13100 [Moritella viscosa]|uniref:hypothetical protein n=1 Tax=Moritella viscosa TaxID=80854 RepID=UPI000917EA06|nr:hypothetical protein [Moritella viscosa]SHO15750.1 DNA relaxation protein homolog [Moritella viscosa]SHO16099.1 DNA relaxation protein homolog [Moritella viscosa]SHO18820.1 DNA relaxation protein homolog [Moritella viscosa]
MAIFTLAHEGKNLRQLRNIVRYNSKNKKGFNSDINPRLIGVHSNCGYCLNIDDENEYKQLVENFILTADANSKLSSNSRQKYLYEHSVISFSVADDNKLGMKKATELAIETAKQYDPNFENLPYLLWPQIDSGKLHFHVVKCYFNEQGKYFKQSFPMKKMNSSAQKIEKNHNLTFTGKNDPNNYIWKTNKDGKKKKIYFPQGNKNNNKITKNRAIDLKIKIDDKGNIEYFNKLTNELITDKSKANSLFLRKKTLKSNANKKIKMVNSENKKLVEPVNYPFIQKYITNHFTNRIKIDQFERSEKIKINKIFKVKFKKAVNNKFSKVNTAGKKIEDSIKIKNAELDHCKNEMKQDQAGLDLQKSKNEQLNEIKNIINQAYRHSKTPETFIKKINDNSIEACISFRENGQGGITFNHLNSDISIAGGKVNAYLTFGKIKKNDPELFDLLIGNDPQNTIYFQQDHRPDLDQNFDIEKINENYKQKVNFDGSISIFYHKKDAKKYPYNHNIKVSKDFKAISFGQRRTDHDLKLAYDFAKKSGWKMGISENKDLVKSLMALSYKQNKEDLFFFQTTEATLKITDLKAVIGDDRLSKDNLIKLYDDNIVIKNDNKELRSFIINQLKDQNEDLIIINKLLDQKLSLKDCLDAESPARKALFKERKSQGNSRKIEAINLKNDGNQQANKVPFLKNSPRNKLRYT